MSKIAWTGKTWNPIVGCSKISAGCQNCYAEKMAVRLAGMGHMQYKYLETITQESPYEWSGKTTLTESELEKPLHWRKARKIFVCSMGDLFHESVPFEWIDKVFAVMALCPQHTFQVLTKRADRMKEYIWGLDRAKRYYDAGYEIIKNHADFGELIKNFGKRLNEHRTFPNVWMGVTAENQEMADSRIPILLQTPAAKRFVSVEPMLGAVDLMQDIGGTLWIGGQRGCGGRHKHGRRHEDGSRGDSPHHHHDNRCNPGLDWVIVGAESGAGRRKCKLQWAQDIVTQCKIANVPVFVKQLHGFGEKCLTLEKEPVGWPRQFPCEAVDNNQ